MGRWRAKRSNRGCHGKYILFKRKRIPFQQNFTLSSNLNNNKQGCFKSCAFSCKLIFKSKSTQLSTCTKINSSQNWKSSKVLFMFSSGIKNFSTDGANSQTTSLVNQNQSPESVENVEKGLHCWVVIFSRQEGNNCPVMTLTNWRTFYPMTTFKTRVSLPKFSVTKGRIHVEGKQT